MAKINYGMTWWGEKWLCALKDIDYSNRLPRGASYARNGKVMSISFDENVITATVSGSHIIPYKESITLKKFDSKQVEKLIDLVVSRPVILTKLFNRQLDEELATLAEQAGMQLFPKRWSDLDMICSCPDWAVPCKHLAAVIYKVSMEIDNNPFLVFSLHGVDLLGELNRRGFTTASEADLEIEDISTIINVESVDLNVHQEVNILDYTTLSDLVGALPRLLKPSPVFYNSGDFLSLYQKELQFVAKEAKAVLQGKRKLVEEPLVALSKRDEFMATHISDIAKLQQLLDIETEYIDEYSASVVSARQLLVTMLQLIAHGCIVPQIFKQNQIVKRGKKNAKIVVYRILWQPAMLDQATADIVKKLDQPIGIMTMVIGKIIEILSHEDNIDVFKQLFFNWGGYEFVETGETSMPGGIRTWLSRYFIQNKYQLSFVVDETDDGFSVNVEIDGQPLHAIMNDPTYKDVQFDMVIQLSNLCDMISDLDTYINNHGEEPMTYTLQSFTPFLMEIIPAMRLLGIKAVMPKSVMDLIRPKASFKIKASGSASSTCISMADLLSFDWQVALGDEVVSVEDFTRLLGNASGLIRFKQRYVYMNEADIEKLHKSLTRTASIKPGELLQAAFCEEFDGAKVILTPKVRAMIDKFKAVEPVPSPTSLHATLRPYQERGFSWMYRNMQLGFGSIIADDMGLGKTLQVITLLLKMREEGAFEKRQALVVVPTGLLFNWQQEIERFAPELSVAIYHGTMRNIKQTSDVNVILTTYGVVRSDVSIIKKLKLQVLVIDEAQNIKNSSTAQSKAIRSLDAVNHIAMSGTPVENRLSEFWSIIDFTNKGYLGSLRDFNDKYAAPIQKDGNAIVAERFRKVTAPFLMRRLKSDKSIISDLPDKIERNEYAYLTAGQTALYQETLNKCMELIEGIEDTDSQSLFKRQGLILQMILALKQICNHPSHFLKDGKSDPTLSGKAVMLLDLVRSIVDAKEKVLVFTQFREMGEMLQKFIHDVLDCEAMFYHGGCSLKQRKEMVERFQNNKNDRIFILSLKAAGTGLNLTAATHVIHYDLWWNPAVEAQATDRAYRIGQHSNVQVHRFITKDTFEQKIDKMIQDKKHLAEMTVATGENWIGKLSNEELREIFG